MVDLIFIHFPWKPPYRKTGGTFLSMVPFTLLMNPNSPFL